MKRRNISKLETVKSYLTLAAAVLFVVVLVGTGIWYETSLWNECRDSGHSFFYCARILSK